MKKRLIGILKTILALTLCLSLCFGLFQSAFAGTLTLPSGVKVIEEEAFANDASLVEIEISEGTERIESKAFAYCNLERVYIPASVQYIADDAFLSSPQSLAVCAPSGSTAYQWATAKRYNVRTGVLGFTYTYVQSFKVGSTVDISVGSKFPASMEISFFSESDNVSVSESGSVTILDEGSFQISFRDSEGKHFLFSEAVENVFLLHNAGEKYYVPAITVVKGGSYGCRPAPPSGSGGKITQPRTYEVDTLEITGKNLGAWNAEVVDGSDWITLSQTTGTTNKIPMSIIQSGENHTGEVRVGHVKFMVGKYEYLYEVMQDPVAVETYSVSGMVIDSITGNGIEGVTVSCQEYSTITDENGNYVLALPAGTYTLHYELEGYAPYDQEITVTEEGGPTENTVILSIESDFCFESIDSETCKLTLYYGPTGNADIEIPSYINGKKVTCIGQGAFKNQSEINGYLVIPNTITTIEDEAFYGCSGLIGSLVLPNSVVSIGDGTFEGCNGFTGDLSLPNSLVNIGERAFSRCTGFTGTITIPTSIKIIQADTFYGDIGLDEVILPDGITTIESRAFANSGVKEIFLPSSLKSIAVDAFSGDNVIGWGPDDTYASRFFERQDLTYLGGNGTTFRDENFIYYIINNQTCSIQKYIGSDSYVLIPLQDPLGHYVTGIADNAFSENAFVETVWSTTYNIGKVGTLAFANCPNLKSVYLWDGVTQIASDAFQNSPLLTLYSNAGTEVVTFAKRNNIPFLVYGQSQPDEDDLDDSLIATATGISSTRIKVSYNNVRGALGYRIYTNTVNNIATASYYDQPVVHSDFFIDFRNPNTSYYIWVTVLMESGESTPVACTAKTLPQQGALPTQTAVYMAGVTTTESTINLVFPRTANCYGYLIWYREYIAGNTSAVWQLYDTDAYNFTEGMVNVTVPNLASNTIYEFMVQAYNRFQETGELSNSYTFTTQCRKTTLYGRALTEDLLPIKDVYVTLVNPDDETDVFVAITDRDGEWSISGLTESKNYDVYVRHMDYVFDNDGGQIGSEGYADPFIGHLAGDVDTSITFTMKQKGRNVTSIEVGTSVDFNVTAANASYVRLVADGITYEAHPVTNGTASFSRMFSSVGNGTRKIQMQTYTQDDGWLGISPAKNLSITFTDTLIAPELPSNLTLIKGNPLEFTWSPSTNASRYTVYVYSPGGIQLWPDWREEDPSTNLLTAKIPAKVFSYEGDYSVQVVASGVGYDSATGVTTLHVYPVGSEVCITSPAEGAEVGLGDELLISVSGVVKAEEWKVHIIPENADDMLDQYIEIGRPGTITTRLDKTGRYTLTAETTVDGYTYTSEPVHFTVPEPKVEEFTCNGHYQYCWEIEGTEVVFRLKTNFTLFSNSIQLGSSIWNNQLEEIKKHVYEYKVALTGINTKKEYKFSATDINGNTYGPYCVPVYVMGKNPNSGNIAYLKEKTQLYTVPGTLSSISAKKYASIKIQDGMYNSFYLVKYQGKEYFLDKDLLEQTIQSNRKGISTVTPNSNPELYVMKNGMISFQIQISDPMLVDSVDVNILEYGDGTTKEETLPCQKIGESEVYKYDLRPSKTAKYYSLEFVPRSTKVDAMQTYLLDGFVYVIEPVLSATWIYQNEAENYSLHKNPYDDVEEQGEIVSKSERLKILGYYEDGWTSYLVETSTGRIGYLFNYETSPIENMPKRRGYIFMGQALYSLLRNHEISGSVEHATNLFRDAGVSNPVIYERVTNDVFSEELLSISQITDFNDTVYIFIETHGNLYKDSTNGFMNLDSTMSYNTLAAMISGYFNEGNVVLILAICHSGSIKNAIDNISDWDNSRFSVIASTQYNQSEPVALNGWFGGIAGSSLISALDDNCTGNSTLDIDKTDGGISLSELRFLTEVSTYYLVPFSSNPVYIGDGKNIVFPK